MKILAIGDLHGDKSQAKKLAQQAEKENVDIVVFAGDITFAEQDTRGLIGPFAEKGKKVVLIPGNHESLATTDFLTEFYGAKSLHGYSLIFKDIGLFGCGSANLGLFQLSEKEVFDLLKQGQDRLKLAKKRVMVTHVHPEGSLISKFSENLFPGSTAVAKAIKQFQPDIAICSHIHEAEGLEEQIGKTKLFCVGKKGRIIEV